MLRSIIQIIITTCLTFLAPVADLLILMFILVLADLITGICASRKEGKKINSHTAGRTGIKLLAFELAIILSYAIEYVYLPGSTLLTKSITSFLILVEFGSNMENLFRLTGMQVFLDVFNKIKTYFNTNKNIINSIDYKSKEEREEQEKIK